MIDDATRAWLLSVAWGALVAAMRERGASLPLPSPVSRPVGALPEGRVFVSWHDQERLVGCIGTMSAREPLEEAVARYAVVAGLHDTRTPDLPPDRVPYLECEISVLSPPAPLTRERSSVRGLAEIAAAVAPHRDGVVLRGPGGRSAVFLPVVWESLPEPGAFLERLCRKAGLDPARDGAEVTAETFRAEVVRGRYATP